MWVEVIFEFPKIQVPYFGVLLFRVVYWVPLFSETPIFGGFYKGSGVL